jgi:hypothetical protein
MLPLKQGPTPSFISLVLIQYLFLQSTAATFERGKVLVLFLWLAIELKRADRGGMELSTLLVRLIFEPTWCIRRSHGHIFPISVIGNNGGPR